MVLREVIDQRVVWDVTDLVLQVAQVADAHDFAMGKRIDDDKVTEAKVGAYFAFEFLRKVLRLLPDESCMELLGVSFVGAVGRFEDEGDNHACALDILAELEACVGVFFSAVVDAHV